MANSTLGAFSIDEKGKTHHHGRNKKQTKEYVKGYHVAGHDVKGYYRKKASKKKTVNNSKASTTSKGDAIIDIKY